MTPPADPDRYKNHRFPGEIISHGVWLYYRFTLSYRDVEELLSERGITVSHEAVRQWCRKFGQEYANRLRRRRLQPGDKWHLDEVFLTINGERHYLWRAVDQDGNVLDILVQRRRNKQAAKKFFRKLLKGLTYVPRVLITDTCICRAGDIHVSRTYPGLTSPHAFVIMPAGHATPRQGTCAVPEPEDLGLHYRTRSPHRRYNVKDNSIRRAVREGRAALGTGIREFASRGVPWIIQAAGFDYCMIDMEHGAFTLESIANLATWFAATDVSPIVRIHKAFIHYIPLLLDQGIMGIQISGVDTAEEARAIVQEAKYPPLGHRGISGMGPHTGYQGYGAAYQTTYAPWANDNIIICPSIESLEGLQNVDAIAAVEGIDMVAYGHSDLSAALGIHLQLEHPRFKEAMQTIVAACKTHGKLARGSAETEAQIAEYWQLGCQVLNLPGTDLSTYLEGLKARAGRAHARLQALGVPLPPPG